MSGPCPSCVAPAPIHAPREARSQFRVPVCVCGGTVVRAPLGHAPPVACLASLQRCVAAVRREGTEGGGVRRDSLVAAPPNSTPLIDSASSACRSRVPFSPPFPHRRPLLLTTSPSRSHPRHAHAPHLPRRRLFPSFSHSLSLALLTPPSPPSLPPRQGLHFVYAHAHRHTHTHSRSSIAFHELRQWPSAAV